MDRMPYKQAMELRAKGQLTRRVMTEKGWVTPLGPDEVQPDKTLHLPRKK